MARIEQQEIGGEARGLAVAGGELGVAAQGVDLLRRQVRSEREPALAEFGGDRFGVAAEMEAEPVGLGKAGPPVVGIALELEPALRLEAQHPEGAGADAAVAPGAVEEMGAFGDDRGQRVRQQAGKKAIGRSSSISSSWEESSCSPAIWAAPSRKARAPLIGSSGKCASARGERSRRSKLQRTSRLAEAAAVVEAHALAQVKVVAGAAAARFPALRQPAARCRAPSSTRTRVSKTLGRISTKSDHRPSSGSSSCGRPGSGTWISPPRPAPLEGILLGASPMASRP